MSRSTTKYVPSIHVGLVAGLNSNLADRVSQVALTFDDKTGAYNQHCTNIEHTGKLETAQQHQKVVALLTLGEILVEEIIPVGTLPEIKIAAGATPSAEQLRAAFESYPFFTYDNRQGQDCHYFKMDLGNSHDDGLFKDVCIDIYKKSTELGGEYNTLGKTTTAVTKAWVKFINPPSAGPGAGLKAVVWRLLERSTVDTPDGLLAACSGDKDALKKWQADVCGEDATDLGNRNVNATSCKMVIKDFVKVLGKKPQE